MVLEELELVTDRDGAGKHNIEVACLIFAYKWVPVTPVCYPQDLNARV